MSPVPINNRPFSTQHILNLTDDFGLIEHGIYSSPRPDEGYSLDDNARALQLALRLPSTDPLVKKLPLYFNFVVRAQTPRGFHNDFDGGTWHDDDLPNEHFGRAMAAIAETAATAPNAKICQKAAQIFADKIPFIPQIKSLRAQAQLLVALSFEPAHHIKIIQFLADKLVESYQNSSSDSWHWFEDQITYDNCRLPIGLLCAYRVTNQKTYLKTALSALDFFLNLISRPDHLSFPGNNGWFTRSGNRAQFAQQPIEAGSTVETCSLAYLITHQKKYYTYAQLALDWYLGRNILGQSLYDPQVQAIYDGLEPNGPNLNHGAESTLSYLLAYLAFQSLPLPHVQKTSHD